MEKENIKKLFKDFNWKLPETKQEEWQNKYHFRDILRVIEEAEKQINLSLGNVSNTEGKVCITCKKTLTYSEAEGGNCCDVCWLST